MSYQRENQPVFQKPRVLNRKFRSNGSQLSDSSQASSQSQFKFYRVINIAKLAAIIKSKGRDNVRAPMWFKEHDEVRRAMGSNAWPSSDQFDSDDSENDLVIIRHEYFLIINKNLDRILHFANRYDYISHFLCYYFSPKNLSKDNYMMDIIAFNDGTYPLRDLLHFPRLCAIEATGRELYECSTDIDTIHLELRANNRVFNLLSPYVLNRLASKATPQTREEENHLYALQDPNQLLVTYPNIRNLPITPCPDGLTPQHFLQLFSFPPRMLPQGFVPAGAKFILYFPPQYCGFQQTNAPGILLSGSIPQPPPPPQCVVRSNIPRFQTSSINRRHVKRD